MKDRVGMNIIIVAKFLRAPKQLALRDPRVAGAVSGALVLLLALGGVVGYAVGSRTDAASLRVQSELRSLRAQIGSQQAELEAARTEQAREVDALAVRLGELQAQATRLNALGERLTRVAQLDDGEFDFALTPGLGGPDEAPATLPASGSQAVLSASLEAFAERLSRQSDQLGVLETLLLDRELDDSLKPAGLPVRGGYASSAFGHRADPIHGRAAFHRGVDFNGVRGADVLSVAEGVVVFSGRDGAYGNMIDLDHGNGYVTRYAHNHENLVRVGERVRAGQVIAKMGATGRATGVHVHFEVWHNDRPINPHQFLKSARG